MNNKDFYNAAFAGLMSTLSNVDPSEQEATLSAIVTMAEAIDALIDPVVGTIPPSEIALLQTIVESKTNPAISNWVGSGLATYIPNSVVSLWNSAKVELEP